ncbi:hypothetical protein, partial [Salmonella enterica]|uniref:hypothetical protein n=1 Tax=Salmonella enterica TaxID=28901 RepID=UPI003523CC8D
MEHPWDAKCSEMKKKRRDGEKRRDNEDNTSRTNTSSTTPEEMELSFAQLENSCYCCGRKGHLSNKCGKRDIIPRDQWYINKLQRQETSKIQ